MPSKMCIGALGVAGVAMAAAAGLASAQSVDYRIVERTGQTVVNAGDTVLNLAVQARVTSTNNLHALGNFGFTVRIAGEAEAHGALGRDLISNLDGTYAPTIALNSVVGRGGLARSYCYLAGINSTFLGVINSSAGNFTNGPDQELALVGGALASPWLLGAVGIDVDGDSNPDTWSGNGLGGTPLAGETAALNAATASVYFGQGEYVDVYRFRYTVTNLSMRTLHFQLDDLTSSAFTQFSYAGNEWGANSSTVSGSNLTFSPLDVSVVPGPSCAVVLWGAGVLAVGRRRRR